MYGSPTVHAVYVCIFYSAVLNNLRTDSGDSEAYYKRVQTVLDIDNLH